MVLVAELRDSLFRFLPRLFGYIARAGNDARDRRDGKAGRLGDIFESCRHGSRLLCTRELLLLEPAHMVFQDIEGYRAEFQRRRMKALEVERIA